MITPDTFYKEVRTEFHDLNDKIDKYQDENRIKIDDLCTRITKIETEKNLKVNSHGNQIKAIGIVSGLAYTVLFTLQVFHVV